MTSSPWFWAFNASVLLLWLLELLIFHLSARPATLRAASVSILAWVSLAAGFNAILWHGLGAAKGMEFLAGYLIEYSLSVDNLFLFVMIFSYFRVGEQEQRRILLLGVLGAFVMRGLLIAAGATLLAKFSWLLYLFGLFLFVTGIRMAFGGKDASSREKNLVLRLCLRWMPVAENRQGERPQVRQNGMLVAAPLVLITIELVDLVFAVDSIPAVFGITRDPFIVYSSNVCAILGLRSMYFLLAHVVNKFAYLKYGLAAVLSFVGVKMLVGAVWEIPTGASLAIVGGCLLASVLASLKANKDAQRQRAPVIRYSSEPPKKEKDL